MSIDSFGFKVMSLRELLEALNRKAEGNPALLDKPVWVTNAHPLHMPILQVREGAWGKFHDNDYGVSILLERGGN